ncbi:hypothetical protein F506_10950 [Herbaspirillum hiltneri N3]|uniref:Uncharacterized protein n=1 Tax=Herbaspirillum hiltneri N3 TaxID=1262470 RepID=A0ABN4HYQ0_9BURK|nr:hypothetical protein F506_10950 [Herbaspirillum hiltneri N3]
MHTAWRRLDKPLFRFCRIEAQIHSAGWYDSGNGVFVYHLGDGVAQQDHILIERFNMALQLDPVDQIDRNGYVFFS